MLIELLIATATAAWSAGLFCGTFIGIRYGRKFHHANKEILVQSSLPLTTIVSEFEQFARNMEGWPNS